VRRYFYSIDQVILRRLLFRHLPEPKLRELLERIIASGAGLYRRADVIQWLGWDGPGRPGAGLPIGNLTSQFWGNVYLSELDHIVCRALRVPWYQRYMDDFTLFSDDAEELLVARERIGAWLAQERHLELKDPGARPERTDHQLHYLGYEVTRGGLRLGPKARGRMPERLGAAVDDPKRLTASITSYAAAWKFGQ